MIDHDYHDRYIRSESDLLDLIMDRLKISKDYAIRHDNLDLHQFCFELEAEIESIRFGLTSGDIPLVSVYSEVKKNDPY